MGFIQEKIYPRLPVFAQNWALTLYGYQWYKRRFGGIFEQELKRFRDREGYNSQQWRDHQTVELRRLLCHAFETVPFYREKYSKMGFTTDQLRRFELEHLKKLPFLEKEDLRKFGTSSLISSKREKGGQFFASSGSTGTPTQILISHQMHQKWSAGFEARIRHWAGVNYRTPRGMIGGRRVVPDGIASPPYYRYNFFEKQTYFSAYHISRSTAANYLEGIIRNGVTYMTGYAMSNYFLANMLQEQNLEVPTLKAVITSSEKLTPEMREVFRKVYNCKTYDSYSGVEACGLISETADGELLVSPDVGILEVLDENGQDVQPGKSGEVISTGLLNFDQPLIRYRIGDCVSLAEQQNTKSGLEMPVIKEIEGRVEDIVVGKDGREIVRFHGLYINIPHLIAAQIVQNDYDNFTFNIVTENGFSQEQKDTITKRLESQLGPLKVSFNIVPEIPKNKNGKFQAVISKIKKS